LDGQRRSQQATPKKIGALVIGNTDVSSAIEKSSINFDTMTPQDEATRPPKKHATPRPTTSSCLYNVATDSPDKSPSTNSALILGSVVFSQADVNRPEMLRVALQRGSKDYFRLIEAAELA